MIDLHNFKDWIEYVPFLSATLGNRDVPAPIITRVLETAIMSVVAGAVGVYVGVEIIKVEVNHLKQEVVQTQNNVERIENKLDRLMWEMAKGAKS